MQVLAERESVLEFRLLAETLVAGPTVVATADAVVHFLPGVPADFAEIRLTGLRMEMETERIAHAVQIDLGSNRVRPVVEGIVAGRGAVRIDAKDLAIPAVQILRAQRMGICERRIGAVADTDV